MDGPPPDGFMAELLATGWLAGTLARLGVPVEIVADETRTWYQAELYAVLINNADRVHITIEYAGPSAAQGAALP